MADDVTPGGETPSAPRGPRLRADLASLPAYRAGQGPARRPDLTTYKISSNENPHDPLPSVLEAIAEAARAANRYPDPMASALTLALADRFEVPADHVALGTGSVALCGQLTSSTCAPGDEVLFAWRSFEAYPIWTQIAGATSVMVPLTSSEEHDLDAMADSLTERTRLVFVCTPNNPTGPVVKHVDLERFLDRVPDDILVVVDEAYVEFVRDPEAADGLALYRERSNVAVLRTFSKAYGLAGLRVGFCLAPDNVADYLRRTATPFGVSTLAQAAALASLAAEEELLARVDHVVAERTRMYDALLGQGWRVPPSEANFVWLRLGDRTLDFAAAAEEVGLTVRPFAGEGVRITVAETDANDRLIELAAGLRGAFADGAPLT
jgi:histidinol-phosphate aminotransferase